MAAKARAEESISKALRGDSGAAIMNLDTSIREELEKLEVISTPLFIVDWRLTHTSHCVSHFASHISHLTVYSCPIQSASLLKMTELDAFELKTLASLPPNIGMEVMKCFGTSDLRKIGNKSGTRECQPSAVLRYQHDGTLTRWYYPIFIRLARGYHAAGCCGEVKQL